MKQLIISLLTFLSITTTLHSQLIIERKSGLVSQNAYSKKISKDFSFLILGDNSPQQGVSATLNDGKNSLKINGLLYSGSRGILSVEADLTTSNGFYFFDDERGSERGKFTFNYYKRVYAKSEYYSSNTIVKTSIKLEVIDLITQAKSDYLELRKLVEENISPKLIKKEQNDRALKKLRSLTRKYINSQDVNGYNMLEKRNLDKKGYTLKNASSMVLKEVLNEGGKKQDLKIMNGSKKHVSKILRDYLAKEQYILKELEDKINEAELKIAEPQWAGNHIVFLGVSPFYERQSINRFSFDNTKRFEEMFTEEKGNTYGITLSLNYSLKKGEGSRNPLKPENLFIRFLASFDRASNIASFSNDQLNVTSSFGNDVEGNPVTFTNSDEAFIGDTPLDYGFGSSFFLETYYYPFKAPIGLFGRIGYENVTFNRISTAQDEERYPMRLGALLNLKNKKKDKTIIVVQAFLDRTDLKLHPTRDPDNDLRFGLGIGLPINLR